LTERRQPLVRDDPTAAGPRWTAAAVICTHIAGLLVLDKLDRLQPPKDAGQATEIPVEVVQSEDADKPPPDQPQPAQRQKTERDAAPETPAEPTRAEVNPGSRAPSPVLERPRETDLAQKAGARGQARDEQGGETAPQPRDAPFGALARLDEKAETPKGPTFLAPQTLLERRPAPQSTETGNDNYRAKVLTMVSEAMIDPDRPRPPAVALVAFTVDDRGELASIALAKPSGHAELDAEALDMVRRAAPFPPPPANADRRFGAFIEFGGP